ncbi:MAG: GNAT family N-acetyltransferase [Planctomycetota bacterium]|jgi:predicted GNAT family N-acyltransferase
MATEYREVAHGSDEYRETVALRDAILRAPLGLAFDPAELEAESDSRHLACLDSGRIIGCLVLKPLSPSTMKMRQLAVAEDRRGEGVGSGLVGYAEEFARSLGFGEIVMHARETAAPFYERLGHAREGDVFIEVTVPHVAMRKRLD